MKVGDTIEWRAGVGKGVAIRKGTIARLGSKEAGEQDYVYARRENRNGMYVINRRSIISINGVPRNG